MAQAHRPCIDWHEGMCIRAAGSVLFGGDSPPWQMQAWFWKLQAKIAATARLVSGGSYQKDTAQRMVEACQPASAAFTAADTWPMSALPARRVLTTPMTLPMSPGPLAPTSATMAWTAAITSASDIRAGR